MRKIEEFIRIGVWLSVGKHMKPNNDVSLDVFSCTSTKVEWYETFLWFSIHPVKTKASTVPMNRIADSYVFHLKILWTEGALMLVLSTCWQNSINFKDAKIANSLYQKAVYISPSRINALTNCQVSTNMHDAAQHQRIHKNNSIE